MPITRAEAEAIVAAYALQAGAVPMDADVVELDDLWFFPVGYIGSRGVIVDRADGRLSVLGSGPSVTLDDCFWGHRRGFTHELAVLTVMRVADLPATLEFLFYAVAEGPRGRNPWPRRRWLEDKLGKLPVSFAPQRHGLAIPNFRELEKDAPFEWRLDAAPSRVIAALFGLPDSGNEAIVSALATRYADIHIVDGESVRGAMRTSDSDVARAALEATSAGLLISDDQVADLTAESVRATTRPTLIVGLVRNEAVLRRLESQLAQQVRVIRVHAALDLIDARRAHRGLPPLEVEHPGAYARATAAFDAVEQHARARNRLIEVNGSDPIDDVVDTIGRRVFDRPRPPGT